LLATSRSSLRKNQHGFVHGDVLKQSALLITIFLYPKADGFVPRHDGNTKINFYFSSPRSSGALKIFY
jgi:hypothetical protein